jgi:oligopeptide transport system substrate-binding protein
MWRSALNIRVELAHLEFKSYVELMNRVDFDILRSRWIGDYDDPKTYLDMFVTAGGNNNTNWSNADYDRLIREASRTTDPEARFELFQQAEEILLRELPVTPIFFGTLAALQHPSVRDFGITQTGQVLYKRIRLE